MPLLQEAIMNNFIMNVNDSFDMVNSTNSSTNSYEGTIDYDIVSLASLVPYWAKLCAIVFIVIASAIGIPGNGLVCLILLKQVKKSSTDWFIIFIAIFDNLSLAISGPTTILVISKEAWNVMESTGLCRFHIYMSHFVFIQSLFLITCVGIDRYVKTCKPHSVFFTETSAFRSSLVFILISAASSVPFYLSSNLNIYGDCVIDPARATLRLVTYAIVLLCVLTSSGALIVWYIKIGIQIRNRVHFTSKPKTVATQNINPDNIPSSGLSEELGQTKQGRDKNVCKAEKRTIPANLATSISNEPDKDIKDRKIEQDKVKPIKVSKKEKQVSKTTRIMAAITVVYIFSTSMPTTALAIITAFGGVKQNEVGRIIVFLMMRLYMINNFINPIFYITLSSVFRRKVAETFNTCRK